MERIGYDAVTLGELELGQWELTDSLLQNSSLPVVCTNVECLRDGAWEQVGERYRIIEVNGLRVGILSVIDALQLSPTVIRKADDRLRLLPPMETIQTVVKEIQDRTDVIVLLAHLDARTMEQYASTLTDVDVVLGGHMTRLDAGPILATNAIINRSSTRGQHLAITRLIVSPQSEVVDFGGLNVTLEKTFPEDPDVAQAAELAKEEDRRRVRERAERRREAMRQSREERRGAADDSDGKGGGIEDVRR